jgi:two-component system, NtrC family, nitrogen regulation sensor histidine kinase NtrY
LNPLLKRLLNRNTYFLLAAISLFVIAFFLNKYFIGSTSTRYYVKAIQQHIQQNEKDFKQLVKDTVLVSSLVNQTYNENKLDKLLDNELGYDLFISDVTNNPASPQLLFWNTQTVLPPLSTPDARTGSSMVKLANGIYIYSREVLTLRNNRQYLAECLIPVFKKYIVENENLTKEFVAMPGAVKQVDVSDTPTVYAVKNTAGKVLLYLQKNRLNTVPTNALAILLTIAGFILFFLFIHQVANHFSYRFGFWIGVSFFVSCILLLRIGSYVLPGVLKLRQFELFDPAIYGSTYILSSLGDLLINAILLCWIMVFINRRVNPASIVPYNAAWKNWLILVAIVAVQVVVTFTGAGILQSLVADAKISFNVTNFFSLINTPYSFIGFVILALMALSYFFMSQVLLTIAGKLVGDRNYISFIITGTIGLLFLSFTNNNSMVELNLFVLPWLMVFMWLMQQRIFSGLNFRLNVSEGLFWLFIFSFSISAVIIFENRKIEDEQRRRFAERIALQADPASERLLSVTLAYLDSNFLSRNFDRFRIQQTNSYLKDSIVRRSLDIYTSIYDTRIFTFDSTGQPLFNEVTASYDTLNTIFQVQGKRTAIPGLRYFERSFDQFSYIFRREAISENGVKLGSLFVLSDPKMYKSDALTPELFKSNREMLPEFASAYSYAIYDSSSLRTSYNDYAFPINLLESEIPTKEMEVRQKGAYEELWYRPSINKVVVITRKRNSFIEAITLFAYLFSTFLFLVAFYRFAAFLVRSRLRRTALRQYWQLSIRSQIHSTIILVSLLSFIVIGVATILFFINRYQRNNQDRLTRAIQIMAHQVQLNIEKKDTTNGMVYYPPLFTDKTEKIIREMSSVHGMDVNLYDTTGNLQITSNEDMDIYSTGVVSTQMNPLAWFRLAKLRQVQTVTEEKVGKVDYLSIYSPIRNEDGMAVAFLNIPSYSSQVELKQEISNFLVTVINLNAFIFLIAGAIALFITNRITSSFTIISEKMRDFNLRKTNEVIEWKRDDEIGVLVKEYNKMVQKLDNSAEVLAKSEREGAWRQMARQVAHEIKNPLTPMKLSIQYLQKAIDNNSPDVKVMTTNVAKTLIEQIDHLSKIASDFSQFANIGNPRNEVFDLHEMLHSLSSLYDASGNLDFKWEPVEQRVLLFADRTQLNRLFTNLLQNAIEALTNRTQRIIRMNEELNGEFITISVTDNGEGISEQTQSRIFTPNFTTKSSGTGLGLAMSKGIVEQAKGEIWFDTKEGEGTTFYVKLPLLRATI